MQWPQAQMDFCQQLKQEYEEGELEVCVLTQVKAVTRLPKNQKG
jgi:hypothetical protein